MSSYELILPPAPPTRNRSNGRFMKGYVPANKGKKWDEWLPKEAQDRIRVIATGNIHKYRPKHRPDSREKRRKELVGVFPDGRWIVFEAMADAANYVHGERSGIRRAADSNLRPNLRTKVGRARDYAYKGIRWYYESDTTWISKTNK